MQSTHLFMLSLLSTAFLSRVMVKVLLKAFCE